MLPQRAGSRIPSVQIAPQLVSLIEQRNNRISLGWEVCVPASYSTAFASLSDGPWTPLTLLVVTSVCLFRTVHQGYAAGFAGSDVFLYFGWTCSAEGHPQLAAKVLKLIDKGPLKIVDTDVGNIRPHNRQCIQSFKPGVKVSVIGQSVQTCSRTCPTLVCWGHCSC